MLCTWMAKHFRAWWKFCSFLHLLIYSKKVWQWTLESCALLKDQGPHFLCWILGVVPFNTWLISSWEENNCCYKLSNWQNDNYFHSKWQLWPFWVKYMSFYAFAQLVTTFIFFSAWDKSRDKWDNSQNSTQKMRTQAVMDGVPEHKKQPKWSWL